MTRSPLTFAPRLALPALGVLLVAGLAWQLRGTPASAETRSLAPPSVSGDVARRVVAEGRVAAYPGADVVVGTELAGTLVAVPVEEKQPVRRGQLLAELRSDDLRAGLAEARARVSEIEADIRLYEIDVERARRLFAENVEPEQKLDVARRNLDASRARLATARASVERLSAELDKTRILAPIDGVVIERRVNRGETVEAGAPLVTVADLRRVRIEAEVDEFDAGAVALGMPVVISAEGRGASWAGRVEEIPDRVTGRRLKPQDPSQPTDTRVLLVKVAFVDETPLKLGQRVEVEIGGAGTP